VSDTLVHRRKEERQLFLSPDSQHATNN
jgi:hypothetical protein